MNQRISAAVLAMITTTAALGANSILNGGFETGFANWTRADAAGSDGTFNLQSGAASPINGDVVPVPPGGLTAAMTDAQGPGSHVLYQDFTVPGIVGSATLSFELFIGNRAGSFHNPAIPSLDFGINDFNQQARVDLMTTSSLSFSVQPADVLLNIYQTHPGDAAVSGYTTITTDLTAFLGGHLGQTLRLRFAEVDNVAAFQVGIDNVSLEIQAVPETAPTMACFASGAMVLAAFLRRRA